VAEQLAGRKRKVRIRSLGDRAGGCGDALKSQIPEVEIASLERSKTQPTKTIHSSIRFALPRHAAAPAP
jgi:hypothetical protein